MYCVVTGCFKVNILYLGLLLITALRLDEIGVREGRLGCWTIVVTGCFCNRVAVCETLCEVDAYWGWFWPLEAAAEAETQAEQHSLQ